MSMTKRRHPSLHLLMALKPPTVPAVTGVTGDDKLPYKQGAVAYAAGVALQMNNVSGMASWSCEAGHLPLLSYRVS
jgi:hypothetical protein